jgi:hypothetical protein
MIGCAPVAHHPGGTIRGQVVKQAGSTSAGRMAAIRPLRANFLRRKNELDIGRARRETPTPGATTRGNEPRAARSRKNSLQRMTGAYE